MSPLDLAQYMLNQDHFSQWMGIKLIEVREKYCLIEMPVKQEMIKQAVFKDVIVTETAGVATVYANEGGIIMTL